MKDKKTYFITGGGTGGHIYPAIAVADELLKNEKIGKIYYVGNPNNLEASIVKGKSYEFLPVISSGMPRKACFELLKWVFCMLFAWIRCCGYILKYKPDFIFGTGGYVSAPVILAGIVMRVPFVMHDCDANPGLVTRKFAPFAKSISIAFPEAKSKLKNKKCNVNGNPIRTLFSTLSKENARKELGIDDRLTLCVMGGSQGAKTINNATVHILKTLSKDMNIQIIFQTGKKNYDNVIEQLKNVYPDYINDKNLIVKPYFDDMVTVLKASDIAVSRAGSLSISELCASAIAPIFIPYPYAAADHQRKNARSLVDKGAGLYLEDSDVKSETLLSLIKELVNNPQKLSDIQKASSDLAIYDGVKRIVDQIIE
ncbi:undecaprenyldiphospho-muramoylpentapeptide beta-N-acetylglucosaminyltransferase [bacterium]|nr:undecaprenyldiphospho-muramoylpentapeptide beta-N-acetylglucosaminyltransferase [bacterium]